MFGNLLGSGLTRGLSQGGIFAEGGPLAKTQEKSREMIMNRGVDFYTKT